MTDTIAERIPTAEKYRSRAVVIDHQNGMVIVDGQEFPWVIESQGVSVEVDMARCSVHIPVCIFADTVTVLPKTPKEDAK